MLKASMPALEDGDGFVKSTSTLWEVLVPTSFLATTTSRISQAKLALYLGFFEFVHNARKRGKAMLSALLECLLT